MKVSFSLEYKDYEQFVLFYGKNVGTRQKVYWFARLLFFGLMFILAANEFIKTDSRPGLVVVFLISGVMLFLVFPLLFDWALKRGAVRMYGSMDNDRLTEDKELELHPDGILVTAHGETGITYWKDIADVAERGEYFFVLVQPNGAHIIPKEAFDSEDEIKAFKEELHKLWKAATQDREEA